MSRQFDAIVIGSGFRLIVFSPLQLKSGGFQTRPYIFYIAILESLRSVRKFSIEILEQGN